MNLDDELRASSCRPGLIRPEYPEEVEEVLECLRSTEAGCNSLWSCLALW